MNIATLLSLAAETLVREKERKKKEKEEKGQLRDIFVLMSA